MVHTGIGRFTARVGLRFVMLAALLFPVGLAAPVRAAGPDAASGETRQSLDGDWRFQTDPGTIGEAGAWYASAYDDSAWDSQAVPGNWDTRNAYSSYSGKAWYRRSFTAPADASGFAARLRFEAVYHQAKVWLNGSYLGSHTGGYTPFEFDVANLLNYGGSNTIAVQADNSYSVGAWWPWGGISRDVNLIINNSTRIVWQKVTATPDLASGAASISVQVKLLNRAASSKSLSIEPAIYSKADGALVWGAADDPAFSGAATVAAGATAVITLSTSLPASKVKLWHFDTPNLYRMQTTLRDGADLTHQLSNSFGIRKIEIDGTQFKLNGESVRLVGFNRVPDDRMNGNTEPDWLFKRDVDYMKSMGANMARMFHAPLKPELLDYLDEKGIMIIEEIPVWGSGYNLAPSAYPAAEQTLTEMIERDYNHPSIISWSPGNEISGTSTNGINYVHDMFAYIRANLDSSRYLTYISNTAVSASSSTGDAAQWADFICINQYGGYASGADKVHSLWPDRPIFISEYGASFTSEDPNIGDVSADSILDNYRSRSYVMGASLWTLNDYRSDYSNTPPSQNRPWGVTTTWGDQKRGFQSLRSAYSPVRALLIEPGSVIAGQATTARVTLTPRGALASDMPAYTLSGYRLAWQALDRSGQVSDGGVAALPQISPGDATLTLGLPWTVPSDGGLLLRAALLSPSGYAVLEKNLYLRAPAAPSIKEVLVANGAARVVFNRVAGASSYKIAYGIGALSSTSTSTIDDFVDLSGLSNGSSYQFAVLAHNDQGDSSSSAVVNAAPSATNALLPPKLWHIVPTAGGFYIGYSAESGDSSYTLEYGTSSGSYGATISGIAQKGAYAVAGLSAGTTYYLRMARSGTAGASGYSQEISVTTEAATSTPRAPQLYAALHGDSQVALSFETLEKASGYKLVYGTSSGSYPNTLYLNSAAAGYAVVGGLSNGTTYYFKLSALNAAGESPRSAELSATPAPIDTSAPPTSSGPTIIVDNGQAGYSETGSWYDSSLSGYGGSSTRYSNAVGSTARWTPTITQTGSYNVSVWYPSNSSTTSSASYTVTYSGGAAAVSVDQTQNAGSWVPLGSYTFAAGTSGSVLLSVSNSAYHRADAVRFQLDHLLADDFADGDASGWSITSGSWAVVDDGGYVLRQSSTAGEAIISSGDTGWSNYTVEASIKLHDKDTTSGQEAASGILARYGDSSNFYMLRLHSLGTVQLYKRVNGTFTKLQEHSFSAQINTWYRLKLVLSGSTLTGFVNGAQLISATDSSLASGSIGLRAYRQTISVDDVKVMP